MKLLITGGLGFLGSNLAADAITNGQELLLFDNLYRSGSHENLAWLQNQGKFKFVHGDVRNQNDITRVIQQFKPDAIFHLAGQVSMTASIANPRMDFEVNVLGSLNLLEAVRMFAPEASVIYSSSNKVYGNLEQYTYSESDNRYECIEHPNGFNEKVSLDFRSPYGCSKGAADQYMLDYARIFDLKTVVFRHSSMYGGRQFSTYDQGWVSWFCQKFFEIKIGTMKQQCTISGTGKQVRDVLHAEDVKRLYAAALRDIDNAKGQAFNIGGGISNSLSLLELFTLLEEVSGVELNYIKLPARESDQRFFVADTTKASFLFGWQADIAPRQGVFSTFEWLAGQH